MPVHIYIFMEEFMKKRRLFSFALSGLMAIMLLAACNRSGSAAAPASQGQAQAGKPAYAEITVEVFDRGTDGGKSDPTKNNWTDWIQKKVLEDENIGVTFIPVPRSDENTSLNNLMAAGNPPDICLTYSGELIGFYRDLGGLLDLAPHIDTLLVDLKNFLGPDQALPGRDFIRRYEDSENGSIFYIPSRRMNTALRNIFIRKDWLDKLGLGLPKTTEEFFNTLVAFREQDPGGVGRDKVIPFSMTLDVRWTAGDILDPFIDPNLPPRDRWINTVVDRNFLLPGYKEGFRFLNRMYNAGLIDRDFPLYRDDSSMVNLTKSGVVGAMSQNWDQIYRESEAILSDLQRNVPGAELVPVAPILSSDGIVHKGAYDAAGVSFFIPASCKNPEAALRYINWLAKFENYNFLQIGPAGIVHDIEDGIPKIKNGEGLWIQNSAQNIDYTIMMNGLDLGNSDLNARGLANAYPWPAEMIANAYNTAMINARPNPVVPVTLSAAGPYQQTLVDKGNTIFTEVVTARAADFDRIWDSSIADWLASGAQVIVDERRAKYIEP
jgi:putative aldouronate transport system substrate-binding protein